MGWSYSDLLPYFKRSESYHGGEESYRGRQGPLLVTESAANDEIYQAFLEAASKIGSSTNADYNGELQDGFARMQHMATRGRRSSAASSYLHPIASRPNLKVLTGAQVIGIKFEGSRAVGVEYRCKGQTASISASEIILSAGAFGSPHLLMLSGIGPAKELQELGISPIADLPVGKHLKDHPQIDITLASRRPTRIQSELRFDKFLVSLARAVVFGRGFGAESPGGVTAFVKSKPSELLPDLEFFCIPAPLDAGVWATPFVSKRRETITLKCALLRPNSTGRVWLASSDPTAHPRILTNFLSDPHDRLVMREGIRICRAIAESAAFSQIVEAELNPSSSVQSDDQLDAYLRQNVQTIFHPCGTCRMGSGEDAVVDSDLRVKGISNLRVVDASVMPDHIGATINAAVYAIAERASDLIRNRKPIVERQASNQATIPVDSNLS